ncbi:MAG: NAD(P)-binding domain-containing protein [Actinomycetota bacterium]
MKIGVLGTGMVGVAIATKLAELGHELTMGARQAGNEKAVAWASEAGENAGEGSFADACLDAELVFNCTAGMFSLEALRAAGADNLSGKVLVDVANPLDFSQGMPPTLSACNTDSLGEQVQREFPDARVVKALNTVNASVMTDPGSVPGDHVVFVCGDDDLAKQRVIGLLGEIGWPADRVVDLGDISAARGTEMYMPLWLRMMSSLGTPQFNIALAR